MKLRKPCEHGRYDEHGPVGFEKVITCPGGEELDVTIEQTCASPNFELPRPKYRYVTEWLPGLGPYDGPTDPAEWLRSLE